MPSPVKLKIEVLSCALSKNEYDKVVGKEIAKEIWDTIKTAHEDTNQIEEANNSIHANNSETEPAEFYLEGHSSS